MQAPPGIDSDTSGEDVSSVEDTSPKPKVYRKFNWRNFYIPPDSAPTPSSSDMVSEKKKGARDVMEKTVKFLMEGPDVGEVQKDEAQGSKGEEDADIPATGDSEQIATGTAADATQAVKEKGRSTPANQASQAMLSMLRSFVAQDMVEKRKPVEGEEGKVDPHRSPLGVPLARRKKDRPPAPAPSGETAAQPQSPATPTSPTGNGTHTPPMINPFSVPTSPAMATGFYGYGWPPYHPMYQAGQGEPGQNAGRGATHGYVPPPFYPHPAMLQPWHPGQPPLRESQTKDGQVPGTGHGYLPPHLLAQLGALHQNARPAPDSGARRRDAPVRLSSSSRSRRNRELSDGDSGGSDANEASPAPVVPPKDASGGSGARDKPNTDKQWTKIFICLATSLDIIWRLCQAHQRQHGEDSMPKLCTSLAKQIGSKRSISQAVVEVFGDAEAGKELSRNLKMGVSYIARSEMLKRDPDKLQALIVTFLPKSESSIGSWLNPKIAQVLVITVQKWIDKQLDVNTALHATRTVRDEARKSGVPEGAATGLLDQLTESLRSESHATNPSVRSSPRPDAGPVQARTTADPSRSRGSPDRAPRPQPADVDPRTRQSSSTKKAKHPEQPKPQPEGLLEETKKGVIQPVNDTSPHKPSSSTSKMATKRVPAPIAVPPKRPATPISSASPATMSSSSRYSSPDTTPTPLDSPGTIESDAEADGLLSMADSGPAAMHVDRGAELLKEEEEERRKRKHHKPSKEEVKEAKALLAEK